MSPAPPFSSAAGARQDMERGEKSPWPATADLHRYDSMTSIEQYDEEKQQQQPRTSVRHTMMPSTRRDMDTDRDTISDAHSIKAARPTSTASSSSSSSSSLFSKASPSVNLELDDVLSDHGLLRKADGEIGWDFESAACAHPRSWTISRKLWDFALICVVEAYVLGMSSVGAPVSTLAEEELGISSLYGNFVFTSTYLFGQAVGVIIVPASESFGRKRVLLGGMFLFSCINLAIGLKPAASVIGGCRFLTGMLAAIPMNGIFGSMAELWNYKDRLWVGWIGAMAANAAIIMAPAFAQTIADDENVLGWHWVFIIAAIAGVVLTAVLLTTRESRPSVLLRGRINAVRVLLRDPSVLPEAHPDHVRSIGHFARKHMARPFILLATERVILFVGLLIGLSFGMIFMFLEALPYIFEGFGLGTNMHTLPFLGLAFGLVFSTYTRMYDHFSISRHLEMHLGKSLTPELKLIGFLIGSWVFAFGLWLFSWTIPPYSDSTPMLATCALVMVGYGINEFDTVLTGYLMDAYLSYAGSALAALNFARCITIGTCSVFAHEIFHGLDWNIAGSVLAAAASLFCLGPPLLIHYGERMRCRSRFAVFSAIVTLEERIAGGTLTQSAKPTSPEQMI